MRKLKYLEKNYFARLTQKELEDVKFGCQKVMRILFYVFFLSIFLFGVRCVEVPAEGMSTVGFGQSSSLTRDSIAASVGSLYSLLISTGTISILLCVVARIRYAAVLMIAMNEYVPDERKLDASSLEDEVRLVRAE